MHTHTFQQRRRNRYATVTTTHQRSSTQYFTCAFALIVVCFNGCHAHFLWPTWRVVPKKGEIESWVAATFVFGEAPVGASVLPKQFIEQVAQNITAHVAIAPDEMHSLKLKARDSSKDMSIDATLPIASDATAFVRAWYEFGVWPELDPDSPPLLVYGASTSRVPGPAGWTFVDSQRQALY